MLQQHRLAFWQSLDWFLSKDLIKINRHTKREMKFHVRVLLSAAPADQRSGIKRPEGKRWGHTLCRVSTCFVKLHLACTRPKIRRWSLNRRRWEASEGRERWQIDGIPTDGSAPLSCLLRVLRRRWHSKHSTDCENRRFSDYCGGSKLAGTQTHTKGTGWAPLLHQVTR